MRKLSAIQSATILLAVAAIVATGAVARAQNKAPAAKPIDVRERIVALARQPGATEYVRVLWSPSGKTMLAGLDGAYIEHRGMLMTTQEGPMASAWFLIESESGQAKPFLRAGECRVLPDGRILAINYAPFDTPAADIRGISLPPEREKNTKPAGLFSETGVFLKDAPAAWTGTPSPDGKRYLAEWERDGRNNFGCYRKLAVQAEGEESIELTPPVEQKPGRLVGFKTAYWSSNDAIRASVADMNQRAARTAPPGMWMNVEATWFEYSLLKGEWTPLKGEAVKEALAHRVSVEGGTLFFMEDAVKLVRGAETQVLSWPELKGAQFDFWRHSVSPDGRYCVVKVQERQGYGKGRGMDGWGDPGGPPVDGAPAPTGAPPAATEKPKPVNGLWLLDMVKLSKTRLEFPDEKAQSDDATFSAMGWVGSHTFALVQYAATTTVVDARGVVRTDFKGGSYYLDAETGKLAPFEISGIPWPKFLLERAAAGKGALAVLVRPGPGNPTNQEFRVAVIQSKPDARRLRPPEGFRVGYTSGLWISPDGQALVVSETGGPRLWIVRADKED